MTKWIVGGITVIAVVVLAWYFLGGSSGFTNNPLPPDEGVAYRCDNAREIEAVFSDTGVSFELSDGRSFELLRIPTNSGGGKFSNRDGSIILWTNDYSAFLEENDESTYTGCVVNPLSFQSAGN